MIKSREVIPPSLEYALVANRVLAALASNDLGSREAKDAVNDGLQLLNSMIEGQQLTALRTVSADSYQAALAYGEGVRALEIHYRGSGSEPIVLLRELVDVASSLRENQRVEEDAILEFKSFFQAVRDVALASGEGPIERVI
jgi:hypothetical protein